MEEQYSHVLGLKKGFKAVVIAGLTAAVMAGGNAVAPGLVSPDHAAYVAGGVLAALTYLVNRIKFAVGRR